MNLFQSSSTVIPHPQFNTSRNFLLVHINLVMFKSTRCLYAIFFHLFYILLNVYHLAEIKQRLCRSASNLSLFGPLIGTEIVSYLFEYEQSPPSHISFTRRAVMLIHFCKCFPQKNKVIFGKTRTRFIIRKMCANKTFCCIQAIRNKILSPHCPKLVLVLFILPFEIVS